MANQGNHGHDARRAPEWADISDLIQQVEEQFAGHCEVSIDTEGTRSRANAVWVYAKLWRDYSPATNKPVDVVRAVWPTNQHKTMPGLMFRLLYQLMHCAEARLRAESEDIPF